MPLICNNGHKPEIPEKHHQSITLLPPPCLKAALV